MKEALGLTAESKVLLVRTQQFNFFLQNLFAQIFEKLKISKSPCPNIWEIEHSKIFLPKYFRNQTFKISLPKYLRNFNFKIWIWRDFSLKLRWALRATQTLRGSWRAFGDWQDEQLDHFENYFKWFSFAQIEMLTHSLFQFYCRSWLKFYACKIIAYWSRYM